MFAQFKMVSIISRATKSQ